MNTQTQSTLAFGRFLMDFSDALQTRARLAFHSGGVKFVGCPVALKDIAKPHKDAQYPEKCKAKGCCGPVFEVDRNGKPVEPAKEAA